MTHDAIGGEARRAETVLAGSVHEHPGRDSGIAPEIAYSVDGLSHLCQRAGCDRPIPRAAGQSRPQWLAKRTCSAKCAQVHRRAAEALRLCRGCETPMAKRDNEASTTFLRRKFCSHKCARAQQRPPVPKCGSLSSLSAHRTDWAAVVFDDDPRAIKDRGYPLLLQHLFPKPEWESEV